MRRNLALRLIICLITIAMGAAAFAQAPAAEKSNADPWQQPVTLDIKGASVVSAIDALLKGHRLNYSISLDLQDVIIPSLQISQVPLRAALTSLLKSAGAVYRIENSVVMIEMPKPWSTPVTVDFRDTPLREALDILAQKVGAQSVPVARDVPNPKVTYSATGESYIRAIRGIAKLSGTKFDGASLSVGDSLDKIVDMDFRDTPLPNAIDMLFKETGISYTVDPSIQQLKVTAVLRNIPLKTAITQLLNAAGATFSVDTQGIYHIGGVAQQVYLPRSQNALGAPAAPAANNNALLKSQVVNTKYIGAGQAADVISNTPGLNQVQTTGSGQLILNGTQEGIDAAVQTVNAIDNDRALPRPVRLKITAKITVGTAKGPKTYEASTESVGAERAPSLLSLQATVMYHTNYNAIMGKQLVKQSTPNFYNHSMVDATIVPFLSGDGRISLTGRGHFGCPFGTDPGNELSKDFDLAASVMPGKPFTVAAGSMHLAIGDVDFVVTIVATPEEGRVPLSAVNSPMGGYGGVPPSGNGGYGGYGNNSGYGRYGGPNNGNYGGAANRGW